MQEMGGARHNRLRAAATLFIPGFTKSSAERKMRMLTWLKHLRLNPICQYNSSRIMESLTKIQSTSSEC